VATKLAEIYTELALKDGKFTAALNRQQAGLQAFSMSADKVARNVGRFLLVGAAAVAGMGVLYARQEQAEAKLEQVLKATGQAAGFSADQLKKYAAELQKTTTFGDEATIEAMALLSAFSQIQGETFPQAVKAAMDLSAALGTDLKSSVMQVGKALDDPIRGYTMLRRAGVTFTEAQTEQIQKAMEQNNILGAQQIMLDNLTSRYGGLAEALAKTDTGKILQLKNALGDLAEKIYEELLPAINKLLELVRSLASAVAWLVDAFGGLLAPIAGIVATVLVATWAFAKVIVLIGALKIVLGVAAGAAGIFLIKFIAIAAAVTAIGYGIYKAGKYLGLWGEEAAAVPSVTPPTPGKTKGYAPTGAGAAAGAAAAAPVFSGLVNTYTRLQEAMMKSEKDKQLAVMEKQLEAQEGIREAVNRNTETMERSFGGGLPLPE